MTAGTEAGSELTDDETDLTDAISNARRGFRRDVGALVLRVAQGKLLVPLVRRVETAELGQEQAITEDLSLSPHMLFDSDGTAYVVFFTRPELVRRATERLGWQTEGGPLEYCTLPAKVALDLATAIVDDERVQGLVVNALDATELVLRRHELASIAQGKALPLVGYVVEIPPGEDEERLVAEMPKAPPESVTSAIEEVLSAAGTHGYRLRSTFNPERDLEPHLTLNVLLRAPNSTSEAGSVDKQALADRLSRALEGKLPPPGYIDILFDDPALT